MKSRLAHGRLGVLALALCGVVLVSALLVSGPAHAEGHASSEAASSGHAASGHDHVPHFSDINWFTGLIGESEDAEPGLLWRAPGTPVPLGALLINTAVLFFLLGRFGGPAISAGLKSRKASIAGEIERAAEMKAEAKVQLAEYEGKLAEMEAEMVRIKGELNAQAQNERERMLTEAKSRASEIAQEARHIVGQQLNQARQEAIERAVASAVAMAREELLKLVKPADQERLAKDLFSSLDAHFEQREAQS